MKQKEDTPKVCFRMIPSQLSEESLDNIESQIPLGVEKNVDSQLGNLVIAVMPREAIIATILAKQKQILDDIDYVSGKIANYGKVVKEVKPRRDKVD